MQEITGSTLSVTIINVTKIQLGTRPVHINVQLHQLRPCWNVRSIFSCHEQYLQVEVNQLPQTEIQRCSVLKNVSVFLLSK
jgi:hypothetical protein